MKNTTAVIFPDTIPSEQLIIPLVLVFEPVVYCQAVENDDSSEALSTFCQTLVDSAYCTFHIPAPLADQRVRFLKLVKDLQTRRDDYAAQLAHVSLAGISTGSRGKAETKSSILGDLLSRHGIKSELEEMVEKLLWQARLVLKLGEQFDADQQKMAAEMDKIQQQEKVLFRDMVREEKSPFGLTGRLTSLTPDTQQMQHLRRKAWARLFSFGSSRISCQFFISADTDAVELLCEEYERQTGLSPSSIAEILLPASAENNNFLDRLQKFKSNRSDLLQSIASEVTRPSFNDGLLDDWNTAFENVFPASEYGRCTLVLYRFAGVRIRQLFLDSFGHDEDALEVTLRQEEPEDVIIGLLA